jgi:hypothetical protein
MQIELFTFRFEAARITCYLWSPWRAAALEHRLFNEVKQLPGVHLEQTPEELRVQIDSAGYDHANEVASIWVYLRVGLDRGDMGDGDEPSEWIDLDGFGVRFWPMGR